MKHHGVEFVEIIEGSGEPVTGNVWVRVRVRMFLNKGKELTGLWGASDEGMCFRLTDREIVPGLRYSVDGMRVGGRREVTIGPHLAYGETGIPGVIPPNALLRGQIELLEAGQLGEPTPVQQSEKLGCSLSIREWGEESSRLPRWNLIFLDQLHPHYPSQCVLELEWSTRSDGKWGRKTAQRRTIALPMDRDAIEQMIDAGKRLPADHTSECLDTSGVHSHGGMSPTRANTDSAICRSVSLFDNGEYRTSYVREDSPLWTTTDWGKRIMSLVAPYFTEAPWRQKTSEHPTDGRRTE